MRGTPTGGAARPPVRPQPSTPMPVSREARTVPEPIRPPSGARAAWKRRTSAPSAEDADPAGAGAETQRVQPTPTLSLRQTGPRPSGEPFQRRESSSSGADTLKVAVGDSEDTVDVPMNVGSDTVKVAPAPPGARTVPRTEPARPIRRPDDTVAPSDGDDSATIPAVANAVGGRAGWSLDLAGPEEEGSSTIPVRASEDGETLVPAQELGTPWYENPALVTLLLGLVYPVGVVGTLLSATWATRLQKAAALLSVALLSAGAVALLLLGR